MLDSMFSFQGRIGRLRYFLRALGLGGVIGVLVMLGLGLVIAVRAPGMIAILGLLGVGLVGLFFWSSFALQARRIRDIGWNPLYVLLGWIAFDMVDFIVAQQVPALAIGLLHTQTFLGGIVNLGLGCCLLFWPGKGEDIDVSPTQGYSWPEPDPAPVMPATGSSAMPMTPASAALSVRAAPPLGAASAPPRFGRRGL